MPVAFIAGNSAGSQLVSSLDTAPFTIGSESNKALLVIVTWTTPVGAAITSVVWDPAGANQSLSSVAAATTVGNRKVQAFFLVNPAAGTAKPVRVTWNDSTIGSQAIIAAAYSGAHQTTPYSDWTTANGSASPITVTVPNVAADDMVMDGFMTAGIVGAIGANQTQIGSTVTPAEAHAGSYQDGANGGVMSWTLDFADAWLTGALRIVPASAAGGTPTRGRVSFAELEVPNLLTRGLVSFAELEVPNVVTRGRISFAEFEAPNAPTRGRMSFAELEVPSLLTRGLLSFAEFEVPTLVTRGLLSWAELEVPTAPTRGLVSMLELEAPNVPTRGLLSWVELQTPELGETTQTTQLVAGRPMQGTIVYLMQLVGAVKKITRE